MSRQSNENSTSSAAITVSLLMLSVIFWGWLIAPEFHAPADLNDSIVHQALADAVLESWKAGGLGLDPWIPDWTFGYPVLRHYQPGAHWLLAAVTALWPGDASVAQTLNYLTCALWVFHPLVYWVALRWMGVGRSIATAGALLSPLVSAPALFGWDWGSFSWGGAGLFTQLVAAWPFPLALAAGYRAVARRGRIWPAALLLTLTALAHLIYGYMAAIGLGLLLLKGPDRRDRFFRLLGIYAGTAVGVSFFAIPFLMDQAYILHSRWEPAWKWDSFGAGQVWEWVRNFDLFDHGEIEFGDQSFSRPPILTLLVLAAIALGTIHGPLGFLAAFGGFWLVIFVGRPTWGPVLDLLPFSSNLHLHRALGATQMIAPALAGAGAVALFRRVRERPRSIVGTTLLGLCLALGLGGAVVERAEYMGQNRDWMEPTRNAEPHWQALRLQLEEFGAPGEGRIFAGRAQDFGKKFAMGHVPIYCMLAHARLPALSYMFMAMSPSTDFLPLFEPERLDHHQAFSVGTLLLPGDRPAPDFALATGAGPGFRTYEVPISPWFSLADIDADLYAQTEPGRYAATKAWLAGSGPGRGSYFRVHRSPPGPLPQKQLRADGPEGSTWHLHPVGGVYPEGRPAPLLDPLGDLESSPPPRGKIRNVDLGPGSWHATVDALRPVHAILASAFHPRLVAEVDGARVPIMEVGLHFSGVAIPSGTHDLVVRYAPGPLKPILLVLGLLLGGLWILVEERRRRVPRD